MRVSISVVILIHMRGNPKHRTSVSLTIKGTTGVSSAVNHDEVQKADGD